MKRPLSTGRLINATGGFLDADKYMVPYDRFAANDELWRKAA